MHSFIQEIKKELKDMHIEYIDSKILLGIKKSQSYIFINTKYIYINIYTFYILIIFHRK